MGEQLLSGPSQSTTKLPITDAKVCRSYIVGTCPHDLFTNTKQDIGPCPKVHNEALKNEYTEAGQEQKRKWGFEFDYLRDMAKFVNDCDRRIEAATRRLERTAEEGRVLDGLVCAHEHLLPCPLQIPPLSLLLANITLNTAQTNIFSFFQHKRVACRDSDLGGRRRGQLRGSRTFQATFGAYLTR